MNNQLRSTLMISLGLVLGVVSALTGYNFLVQTAAIVSDLFLGSLQLIGIPIIFLSIIATISGFESVKEMKFLGKKVLKYTLLTTLIAASVALAFYLIVNPSLNLATGPQHQVLSQPSFLNTLLSMFPTNFVAVFLENNVFGAALISGVLGFAILSLPTKQREHLHTLFSGLFQAILKITSIIIRFIPIGIWAFTTLFTQQMMHDMHSLIPLGYYVLCVIGANFVQGFIVLPIILKVKGLSPGKIFSHSYPALLTAFFSKSSSAALPLTIECATKRSGVNKKVANFSLPLCSVINMNGCAAFILITVLFVATQAGVYFSLPMMFMWIILSTLAAIGNASVPMGCYFLASAFLVGMGVPIGLMGLILPIYAFMDMLETALNVWSDISITNIVNKEAKEESIILDEEPTPSFKIVE